MRQSRSLIAHGGLVGPAKFVRPIVAFRCSENSPDRSPSMAMFSLSRVPRSGMIDFAKRTLSRTETRASSRPAGTATLSAPLGPAAAVQSALPAKLLAARLKVAYPAVQKTAEALDSIRHCYAWR